MAIHEYSKAYGIDDEEQREDLFFHVQKLDEAYLNWSRAKTEKQAKSHKPGKRPRRGR